MDALDELHAHLQERPGSPLPRALSAALVRALAERKACGVALEKCLEHDARRRSNAALLRCAELVSPLGSDTHRAVLIEKIARQAAAPGWIPTTPAEEAFALARRLGPVPTSARWIYERIRES